MKKHLLRIEKSFVDIVEVHTKKDVIELKNDSYFENFDEFAKYIKNKKPLYITFLPEEVYIKEIEINKYVKKASAIETLIAYQLKKEFQREFIFTYTLLTEIPAEEKKKYRVFALLKDEVEDCISRVEHKENIEIVTTDYHSLSAIGSHIFGEKPAVAVFVQNGQIIYTAFKNGTILFTRSSNIFAENSAQKKDAVANDIARTLFFIFQQHRDIDFDNLLYIGEFCDDEYVAESIFEQTGKRLSVPVSSLLCKRSKDPEFQKHLLSLGILFIDKKNSFESEKVKATKQFKKVYNLAAILLFLPILYFGFSSIFSYMELTEKQDILKQKVERLRHLEKSIDILPQYKLDYLKNYFRLENIVLRSQTVNTLYSMKSFFDIVKPKKIDLKNSLDKTLITVTFSKDFSSLSALVNTKNLFEKAARDMKEKKDIKLVLNSRIDYKSLRFFANLTLVLQYDTKKRAK
ncbi:hypothetical protein [Nitrosophilus alvini]|uniref:hypothetical protein n=1 Tax=Nitrosophilus alvini TaxID=2714855 RepID=UPI00190D68FB|nr:hypothetical protein [Nitrosophilus alvini]